MIFKEYVYKYPTVIDGSKIKKGSNGYLARLFFPIVYPREYYKSLYLDTPESINRKNEKFNQLRAKVFTKIKEIKKKYNITYAQVLQNMTFHTDIGNETLIRIDPHLLDFDFNAPIL